MAVDLERLVVSLSADIKAYERALAKAQGVTTSALRKIESDATKSMGRVEKVMGRAGSALAGFGKGLVIGGIAAAVAGLTQIVVSSVATAAAVGDLSDKLGITSDKLQELQYGAVQANLDFADLEKGLLKFSKSLGEAQNGSGDLFKILQANGFSQAQIKALDYGQALDIVADLIKNAKNQQDGLLVSTAGFGKGAADEFLEFLQNGKSGLDGFAASAQKAGDVIDAELIKAAQTLDDAWATVINSMTKQTASFVLTTIKEFQSLSGALDTLTAKSSGVMAGRFGMSAQQAAPFLPSPGAPKPLSPNPPSNFAGSGGFLAASPTVLPPSADDIQRLKDYDTEKQRQKATIEGVIEALEFELKQGKASELQQQINLNLQRAGTAATEADKQKIIERTTALFEQSRAEQESIDAGQKFLEQQAELKEVWQDFGQESLDAFESIISGGEDAADVLKKLAIEFIKTAIKARALQDAAGGGTSSGGIFSNILGSLFGGGAPKLYAKGGTMKSGEYGIVGDEGPELMKGPGTVIPFNKLGGNGGGYKVTVNNYGAQVQTRERVDSTGRKELILLIKNQVREETSNPYSSTSGALNARGAKPQLKQR